MQGRSVQYCYDMADVTPRLPVIFQFDLRSGKMSSLFGHHSSGQKAPQAPSVNPAVQQGHPSSGPGSQPGPLVTVVSEANKNYRLTSRPDGVVLAYKNQQDPKQYWYKVDYGDKFLDEEGSRAFILVNKATGQALSHGYESGAAVTQEPYNTNAIDNSVLWSEGKDLGKGLHAIRTVTNIRLNLDADHGDKKHGGIQEGNRLVVHDWNKQDNQKWLITPVGPED
ncbi:unnamed protein product [Calypogeia fissa]